MDSIVIGTACSCLGLFIGGVVAYYIAKVKEFTLRGLTSVVAVIGGAGVLGIFKYLGTPPTTAYWFYPIGLFVGAVVMALLHSRFADENLN